MARNADLIRVVEGLGAGIAALAIAGFLIALQWNVELMRLLAWLSAGGSVLVLGVLVIWLLQRIVDVKKRW